MPQIVIAALFFLMAASLWFGHPEVWHWPKILHVAPVVDFLTVTRPLSIISLVFLAIALVMTRKLF